MSRSSLWSIDEFENSKIFSYRNGSARTPDATGDARRDMPMDPPGPAAGVMV